MTTMCFMSIPGFLTAALLAAVQTAVPLPSPPAAQTSQDGQHRLLVLPLEARPGVDPKHVQVLTDYLFAEARRVPGYNIISQKDIEQMLSVEMRKQMMGCDDKSCLAEIGGALNAHEILFGTVGGLGAKDMVLSLTRVQPQSATALGGGAERLTARNPEALLDALGRLLKRLYPGYTPPEPRVNTLHPALLATLLGTVGTAIQYSALGTMFIVHVFSPGTFLYLALMATSCGLCAGAPLFGSWFQAWLADLVSRKQVALWKPALAGFISLATLAALGPAPILLASFIGLSISMLFTLPDILRAAMRRDIYSMGQNIVMGSAGSLFAAMVMMAPVIAAMVLLPPAVQTGVIFWQSSTRSPDEDARLPTLMGTEAAPPEALKKVVPAWLLGGRNPDQDALEQKEPVTAPASVMPSEKPATPAEKQTERGKNQTDKDRKHKGTGEAEKKSAAHP